MAVPAEPALQLLAEAITLDTLRKGNRKHPTAPHATLFGSPSGKFKVPANLHIGNIGLAPDYNDTVNSIPPGVVGGNMDNK